MLAVTTARTRGRSIDFVEGAERTVVAQRLTRERSKPPWLTRLAGLLPSDVLRRALGAAEAVGGVGRVAEATRNALRQQHVTRTTS